MYVATLPGIVEETGEYESEGWPYGGGATLTHEIGHWMNLFVRLFWICLREVDTVTSVVKLTFISLFIYF